MNKKFNLEVLPDDFLIEQDKACRGIDRWKLGRPNVHKMDSEFREIINLSKKLRPALDHDHFNDGSMVLCDGLVVEIKTANGNLHLGFIKDNFVISSGVKFGFTWYLNEIQPFLIGHNIVAVKIIGALPDYAQNAVELGIPVIDLESCPNEKS